MANAHANDNIIGYIGMTGHAGDGVSAAQYAAILARLDELESSPDFTGSISVAGNSALGNSASDTVTIYRLAVAGNAPSFGAGAAMGSSPGAQTITGSDISATIIQDAGASGVTTGVLWSVAFAVARPNTTYRVFGFSLGTNAADCRLYATNRTVDGFDIGCRVAPTAATQMAVCYWIVGS